jgi:hypothetical protein
MPERTYMVHSMVRKVETRMHRAVAPQHHRFVQRLAGGDIIVRRARPATITESKLYRHLEELKKAEVEGKIRVTTDRGQPVDLNSLAVKPVVEVSKPLPNPPLDSAARDKTYGGGVGVAMPQHARGGALTSKTALPATLAKLTEEVEEPPVAMGGDPALLRKQQAQVAPPVESEPAESESGEDSDEDIED